MKQQFEKFRFLLTEKLTLYPILTGILFLINELRNNAVFYTFTENISLIFIVLFFTLIVDFLSRILIKNKTKAALIACSTIFINLFYLDIVTTIIRQEALLSIIISSVHEHRSILIIPFIFTIWLAFIFFILKIKQINPSLNLYLNILLAAFIFVELINWVNIPVPKIKLAENKPLPINANLLPDQKPDIYYIILDAYTSSESLKKYWNYNNSSFEDSLNQLGFFIASKSKADFASTPLCLASYLNSSSLIIDSIKEYNVNNYFKLIRDNRLFNWLNANKYQCYNYSLFDAFGSQKYYTIFYYRHFLGRTLWYTFWIKLYEYLSPSSHISQINLNLFNKIDHLAKGRINKPLFAYIHVFMPHPPYSFNELGMPFNAADSLTDKQKYLGQLVFTNSLALKAVNHIIKFSKRKTTIIIQGDHGLLNLKDTTEVESLRETHTIFYAIYSPYVLNFPDTISPKSTFKRLIEKINIK